MTEEIEDVAVFFMDVNGIITTWNRAAEVMKGYTAEEAIGQHLELLYTEEDRARKHAHENLRAAAAEGFYKEETWRRKKDGSRFWARINLTALKDDAGELLGFSKITLDLTDHKLLEGCVREREQVRRVLRAANAGSWKWNPDKGTVDVCENFQRLLGHEAGAASLALVEWLSLFHEDDREQVLRVLHDERHESLDSQVRLRNAQGTYIWFFSHADWHRELDSEPWELGGVHVDIDTVKRAEEQARQAVQRLREADARKDEFLAMLAHELRNPLAPIRVAAEVLRRSNVQDERVRKASDVVARQCDHLTSLVDDLLDVSRVTRGAIELQMRPVAIRRVINDAVEQASPALQARRHHLAIENASNAPVVLADEKRLVQALTNLLNNAAKFTPPDGHISVETVVRGTTTEINVRDDGIGIEPEMTDRVFDLFAQAERTPDRSSGGLGLGLALVKTLIELHGGSVACTSEGVGKGSVFTLRLPLMQGASADEPADTAAKPESRQRRQLRIVVVDDNKDAAQTLSMLLQAEGYEVWTEFDPHDALERAASRTADVYLLDIGLPDIDGLELARRLKSMPHPKEPVLVAVTGYGQQNDRAQTRAAGFSHHLVKPVDPSKLLAILEEV
jgi:PAS domain S-box-containing protein